MADSSTIILSRVELVKLVSKEPPKSSIQDFLPCPLEHQVQYVSPTVRCEDDLPFGAEGLKRPFLDKAFDNESSDVLFALAEKINSELMDMKAKQILRDKEFNTLKAELSKVKVKLRVMTERIGLRQLLLDWKKSPDGQAVDT
jgi:hypothetical protein